MNYFEHHIGDYAQATAHLSFVEYAAYHRLLCKYYVDERPLPAEVHLVQRLVSARSKDEKEAVETVLREFFYLLDDGWHQKRCDAEIARYQDKQSKAKASASARWKTKNEDANAMRTHTERICEPDANAMRTQCEGNAHQTPDTSNQTPVPKTPNEKEVGELPWVAPAARSPTAKKATRIPEDWSLTADHERFALAHGLAAHEVPPAFEHFVNHWRGSSSKSSTSPDWSSKWRTWVLQWPKYRSEDRGSVRINGHGYESALDRSRREAMETLTGKGRKHVIDIDAIVID